MEYLYNKIVNVEKLASEIKVNLNLNVMAGSKTDTVNGHINYINGDLKIVFYDTDESPNNEHETTFIASSLTDTQRTQLDEIINNHIP